MFIKVMIKFLTYVIIKKGFGRSVTPGIPFAHHLAACGVWERIFHLKALS